MNSDKNKLEKILALTASDNDGEALSALRKAQSILAKGGKKLIDIVTVGPYSSFDDYMEREEPGYKARMAKEAIDKDKHRREYKEQVIKKYGSKEAVLAPCEREKKLMDATIAVAVKEGRWTISIDKWRNGLKEKPSSLAKELISKAYPLPKTIQEAKAEMDYWELRNKEMNAVYSEKPTCDYVLDLTAQLRLEILSDLFNYQLPATSFEDFRLRLQAIADNISGSVAYKIATVLLADYERVFTKISRSARKKKEEVLTALKDPKLSKLSNRKLAQMLGVSPQTITNQKKKCANHYQSDSMYPF